MFLLIGNHKMQILKKKYNLQSNLTPFGKLEVNITNTHLHRYLYKPKRFNTFCIL